MAPQIKHDPNRAGWENTDFPSVCESCLAENPMVKMLKEEHGAECKLCTRPFTLFTWSIDRARGGKKNTIICLACSRLKNCCQSCMLDLSFGLPLGIRDAALKMSGAGPQSDVNREYYAQNNDRLLAEGLGLEQYENTEGKARELLRKLATSKPYFRKGRVVEEKEVEPLRAAAAAPVEAEAVEAEGPGDAAAGGPTTRTRALRSGVSQAAADGGDGARAGEGRGRGAGRNGGGRRAHRPPPAPPTEKDWLPPQDRSIMSLFITGVEDDLAEFKIRDYFRQFGKIRSLVCSHMSHCAFINFETREAAERAAAQLRGRAVISGCPLRIRWGNPKPIGVMNREQRAEILADARIQKPRWQGSRNNSGGDQTGQVEGEDEEGGGQGEAGKTVAVPLPPGQEKNLAYSSLAGEK